MTTLWTRIFLLGSVLGVAVSLILVSLAVWVEGQTVPVLSPVDVRLQYEQQLVPLEQTLNVLINDEVDAPRQIEFKQIREKVMSLTVPAEAKEFHLALVLKLQQLENLLNQQSIGKKVSLESVTAELKQLLTKHDW